MDGGTAIANTCSAQGYPVRSMARPALGPVTYGFDLNIHHLEMRWGALRLPSHLIGPLHGASERLDYWGRPMQVGVAPLEGAPFDWSYGSSPA
jgi:hypothetical protein